MISLIQYENEAEKLPQGTYVFEIKGRWVLLASKQKHKVLWPSLAFQSHLKNLRTPRSAMRRQMKPLLRNTAHVSCNL